MSTTDAVEAQAPAPDPPLRPRRRRRLVVAGGIAVLAIALVVITVLEPSGSSESDGSVAAAGAPAATATVEQGPLSSQVYQTGTLGYAARADGSPYSVVNQAAGAYTRVPTSGDVIDCGEVLHRVANDPVVLLCGHTPAYRPLSEGLSGPDVRELNRNLVELGYAKRSELDRSSDDFDSETTEALERLQDDLGVDETGTLALDQAVFLPGPLRITKVTATPGTMARPGMPIAQATSTKRRVEVDLDASQASSVNVGDRAQITLPDNKTTAGVVSHVGTVAAASSEEEGGSGSDSPAATIPVSITLKRPRDVRGLEQAPVRAQITTAGVEDALSVPVTALVARAGGGYAVETVGPGSARELVPVELGMFDHANGVVQVTGSGLSAGQRVVVPAT